LKNELLQLFDLTGKTVLVTGASSGFGWYFARVLAAAGANVVVGARRIERLDELCSEITACGGSALAVSLDVTDRESICRAFDTAERHFGVTQIIVNNAGISRPGFLLDQLESDWDDVLSTNLKAVWLVAAEGARRMTRKSVGGSIVNLASILAFGPGKMLGSYMAAKAGVIQLTSAMALEWADANIRVNALAPGYFPTEMTADFFTSTAGQDMINRIPQNRVGDLPELAGPLLLLASDASSYMTGAVIPVDGGHLCRPL
jgi:NAD(P)-dependent dehydrogenase (short-subunit alcohol dehydrogenase family)